MPKTQHSIIRYECQDCGTRLTATYAESKNTKRCRECGVDTIVPLPKIKLSGNKNKKQIEKVSTTVSAVAKTRKPARPKKKSARKTTPATTALKQQARGSVSSKKKPKQISAAAPHTLSTDKKAFQRVTSKIKAAPIPATLQTPLALASSILGVFFLSWVYNLLPAQKNHSSADPARPAIASALPAEERSPPSATTSVLSSPTAATHDITPLKPSRPIDNDNSPGSDLDISKDLLDALKN